MEDDDASTVSDFSEAAEYASLVENSIPDCIEDGDSVPVSKGDRKDHESRPVRWFEVDRS